MSYATADLFFFALMPKFLISIILSSSAFICDARCVVVGVGVGVGGRETRIIAHALHMHVGM